MWDSRIGLVVGVRDIQRRVDNRNIVAATLVQFLQEFSSLAVGETNGIIVEITPSLHVINVIPTIALAGVPQRITTGNFVPNLPHVLEGNLKLFKVCYDILHFGPVGVTPAALVVAKCEVLLHRRQSNGTHLVVLRHLRLSRTRVEGQVDATTERAPGEILSPSEDLLTVCVSQENTMGIGGIVLVRICITARNGSSVALVIDLVVTGIQIERMSSIYIASIMSGLILAQYFLNR